MQWHPGGGIHCTALTRPAAPARPEPADAAATERGERAPRPRHVKLPGKGSAGEVSVAADTDGNLLYRSTFSGKAGKEAISKDAKDFEDPAFRGKALEQARKGLDYLEQNHSFSKQIPGLRNLVKALEDD
ncbi:hypothetical protein AB0N50_37520 [Streptomyces pharetrae]|uniref:hypothetical protein n=1 Tax=Streptomyces pharetrae TaxID=291370 RepID=UPI00345F17A5